MIIKEKIFECVAGKKFVPCRFYLGDGLTQLTCICLHRQIPANGRNQTNYQWLKSFTQRLLVKVFRYAGDRILFTPKVYLFTKSFFGFIKTKLLYSFAVKYNSLVIGTKVFGENTSCY